jgi:RNA polymerase sigma factor (sigma-70 family)
MAGEHERLLRSASRGEERGLSRLIECHLPGLIAFVRARAGARLRARDATLDLVQSACREVLADLPGREGLDEAGFRHWLYLATERKIVDRARHYARDKRDAGREVALDALSGPELEHLRQGLSAVLTPSREAMANEELARLEAALARLSEPHREVILLARIVGLSHAQIGAQLGKSEGAARILLHRALARLARELGLGEDG